MTGILWLATILAIAQPHGDSDKAEQLRQQIQQTRILLNKLEDELAKLTAGEFKTGLDTDLEIDGVRVRIDTASLDYVEVTEAFTGKKFESGEYLVLKVRLATSRKDKKYDYVSWDRNTSPAKVVDQKGNRYKRIDFGINKVAGRNESDTLREEAFVWDVLTFEKPVKESGDVLVTLPGDNIGVKGSFRFRIPKSVLK